MNKHIKWILEQYKAQKWFVLIMVVLTLLSSLVSIAFPYVFKEMLDLLKDILQFPQKYPEPMKAVYRIIKIMFAIGLAQLVTGLYPGIRGWVNMRFEHSLRVLYFKHILTKDFSFFQKFRTGDIVTRLTDDLSDYPRVSWFLCSGIFRAFNSFSMIVFALVVMFSINVKLTLLSIAPLPFMMLIFYFTADKVYTNYNRNQQAISAINNQLEMSFSGIRIVKSFVSEEKYNRFFDLALAKRFKTEMSMVKLNAILSLIWQYIDYIAQIGVILFGGYLAVKGEITVGTFFLFYTYLSMMIYPLIDLPQLFVSGKQAFVNIDRLEEMKNYPTLNDEFKGHHKVKEFSTLSFENVSFQYPDKPSPVLKNVSFELGSGEKMLILGATGSGKTTIANLILGLLKANSGIIKINGKPINEIDIKSLRNIVAYVPQEPLLFGGSVKDNILFAVEQASEKDYQIAVKTSQLEDEIASFPDRDNTFVGNRGLSVSGGQKQRLTIARALIKKPQLLILDDITASLDAENEEKLWQALRENYPDISAIVISHRLSTLHYVDSVLFIDSQGYAHKGSHDYLVFNNQEYHDFLREHLKQENEK
ncbi:MAG TPA: ABC transporter ATP-binding protein [Candidatus Cloacimonas acidaminovorans]|jgi:ATP-binding cassette subfamily B protein|nr:ABC transporter ATP-binding protein [Candidatus Cloacimonas sp.]MDD3605812.1 ABC transporter ATP-binding protein [Candidatus Cloacimonas acidaminovorans]HOE54808.1 ABC transporter ATP-binding protein [Candidatus Cloacimonas acidaminovorans]HOM78958.1 ABC transporter ATP-binding protein [Candidatus Cloacimonas acidaminovorans]HOS07122.1 ABC transporter ATP-binding protein [Candidatus Cloacimonas acidaminovorans]